MSVRPTNEGNPYPLLESGIGYDADANTEDIEAPPDRLPDAVVEVPLPVSAPGIVQDGSFSNTNVDGTISVTLGATPTDGNTLFAIGMIVYSEDFDTPSGWTRIDSAQAWNGVFFGGRATVFARSATGASATVTLTKQGRSAPPCTSREVEGIAAFSSSASADNETASTSIVAGPLTTTNGQSYFLLAVGLQDQDTMTFSWPGGWTELFDAGFTTTAAAAIGWTEVASSDGSEDVTITSTQSYESGWIIAAYDMQTSSNWVPAPRVNDANDATYEEVTEADTDGSIVRAMLDEAYRLATSTLKIGYGTAGSVTLSIVGATLADFSDGATLDSVTFTAAGTYGSDAVGFALPNNTAYQFYRIEGPAGCRIYTWALYEANDAEAAASIAAHLASPTDAHDASAISVADTGGNFAGSDVEAVLAELAARGGPDVDLVTVAATGAAETVDVSVARTYDLTLTADCTLTLTGAVTAEAWFVTLLIRQDGTGGWDVTWPASVEWATAAPTIDPAINALTVVTLGTVDGGTVWLGFPTGGVANLDDLMDVNAPSPSDNDVLAWDTGTAMWVPVAPGAGSGDTSGQFIAGWDGGGSALTAGGAVDIVAPFTGTLTSWTMLPDVSGSAVVGIGTDTYAGYPTFTSIVASDAPTLTSATKATGSALTGWTTAVTAGDILRFTLSSASTVTRLLCVVAYSRP